MIYNKSIIALSLLQGLQPLRVDLAQQALAAGLLQPLSGHTIRGPNWSWLMHRDGESNPLLRSFCLWLQAELGPVAGQ